MSKQRPVTLKTSNHVASKKTAGVSEETKEPIPSTSTGVHMGAEMKQLSDLDKQVKQYESHLGIIKHQIEDFGRKREAAENEAAAAKNETAAVRAACDEECAKAKQVLSEERKKAEGERDRLTEERLWTTRERNQLLADKDALEMKRRDLENDKRKIAGFIQIIDQAIKAWR